MQMRRSLVLWALAFLLILFLAVYQRLSGPTHPLRGSEEIGDARISYKLYRSWTSHQPLLVRVAGNGTTAMRLHYRRYPLSADEDWSTVQMVTRDGSFQAHVPGQPAAGKMAYKVEVFTPNGAAWLNNGVPVVARFKGKIPAWLLILHIVFMFAGMLLAFRAGLGALLRDGCWQRLIPWTLGVTVVGGLFFGPLVQKYAFGSFWTGFPLGNDLTDNKTLFVILLWLAAYILRKKNRWWTVLATALMVVVYLIPHSVLGSELDYKTGKVETARTIGDYNSLYGRR